MKHILTIFTLIIALHATNAQTASQFKKLLKKSVNEIHDSKGKKSISSYLFKEYITAIPEDLLKELPKYEEDTITNVRRLIIDLYYQTAKKNDILDIRQEAVLNLVKACKDKEPDFRKSTGNKLKYFKKEDFSLEAKTILINYLSDDKEIFKNTVRLIGFLDLEEQISKLNELLNDTSLTEESIQWEVRVTLARLGDEEQISYCTELARSKGVNDRIIHYLLTDLVFTRQTQAFDYLLDILYSDATNCRPPNPDLYDPIVCGYRIMELLAPAVEDFPFETYPGTTQLKADDYDKALDDVRIWFREHPDYVIKRDTF
jgi:hypothetical protein